MRVVKIGIMPKEKMREYTLKIARGEIKPAPDAPKIFFHSLRALAEALNDNSQALIEAINLHHPESVKDLAKLVHKDAGNVSRILKRLELCGLVRMEIREGTRSKQPVVLADTIELKMPLTATG